MPELHLPWLEVSVLLPFAAAIAVQFIRNADHARQLCVIVCAAVLACTIGEWADFASLGEFEAHDHWDVFQYIFHRDVFVVDELSAPLLPLAAFLYLTTVITTLRTKVSRFSFSSTLFAEAILIAMLACRSPWLIIALMAVSIVPPWLELRKRGQSTRVFQFHMVGSIGLLFLGQMLVPTDASAQNAPILAGALLTAGALIRSGVSPLHCWIPDLFEKATFGKAILFVTPMTGAYAVMRLVLPVAPTWALQSIALLSLATAVYAAGMALVQTEARRFFAFLFLSHSSLVLVGLELATPIGLAGALCVWLSVGVSLLGFGIALRCVEARIGRLNMETFHGLYEHTPFLAGMFLLTGLASIGFPGTIGFIGTELLIEGAIGVYPMIGIAVVFAAALNGIAVVKAYFYVFTGTRHPATISFGCRWSERLAILAILLLIVGGGLHPQPGVASRYHAASALLDHRAQGKSTTTRHALGDHSNSSDPIAQIIHETNRSSE